MKKIPDPGKFSVSPLYKRASVKLMHMWLVPLGRGRYRVHRTRSDSGQSGSSCHRFCRTWL